MQAPKNGFVYVSDRVTGKLISGDNYLSLNTWASGIDPATGRPVAEGLTVAAIEFAGGIAMDFVDLGHTALVTVTGPIDEPALRAVVAGDAPEQVVPADLRLVVS